MCQTLLQGIKGFSTLCSAVCFPPKAVFGHAKVLIIGIWVCAWSYDSCCIIQCPPDGRLHFRHDINFMSATRQDIGWCCWGTTVKTCWVNTGDWSNYSCLISVCPSWAQIGCMFQLLLKQRCVGFSLPACASRQTQKTLPKSTIQDMMLSLVVQLVKVYHRCPSCAEVVIPDKDPFLVTVQEVSFFFFFGRRQRGWTQLRSSTCG